MLAGCRDDDGFMGGVGGSRAFVTSDPAGGRILVDGRETGRLTPDTITGLSGRHDLAVRLDTLDTSYRYSAQLTLSEPDSTANVAGPLTVRCTTDDCYQNLARSHAANRLRFVTNPAGFLFRTDVIGTGLIWPATTNNRYASGGMPVFAARVYDDSIALGIFDTHYLAGRPVPEVEDDGERVWLRQTTWIVPPGSALPLVTVRGIQILESMLSTAAVDDVIVLRLVFTNITSEPLYQLVDPFMPEAGVTFHSAYVGFVLDPDIGASADDFLSYDPDLDLAFVYDARFEDAGFGGGYRNQPGLVGLRMLDAPPGANVVLNGWPRRVPGGDWMAGTANEGTGWGMMSGRRVYEPAHADLRIGYLPPAPADLRIMVSAGPLTLAPGESVAITVAVVVAAPQAGTFTSGTRIDPGDPFDQSRPLHAIAQRLFARARAAEALLPELAALEGR